MEEVKRGKEDELRVLDGGQVELEHILSMEGPWVEEKQRNNTASDKSEPFSPPPTLDLFS